MREEDEAASRRISRVLGAPSESPADIPPPAVSRRALAVAVVVALVAVAVAVLRGLTAGGGEPEPLPPVAPSAPALTSGPVLSSVPAPSSAPLGASSTGAVLVHVVGQVRRPGVVHLTSGARVADAVAAAGGATPAADLAGVNLARLVTDGEQLLVPKPGEAAPAAAPPAASSAAPGQPGGTQVDLNTATESDLDALPGIGPVIAGRIIAWRDQHGRFTSVDELGEVSGIGDATLTRLRPLVRT